MPAKTSRAESFEKVTARPGEEQKTMYGQNKEDVIHNSLLKRFEH
jgi:hypothetical protein